MLRLVLQRQAELQGQLRGLSEKYKAATDEKKRARIAGQYRKTCSCIEPYPDILALSFLDRKGLLIEYFDFLEDAYQHLPAIDHSKHKEAKNTIEEIRRMKGILKNVKSH